MSRRWGRPSSLSEPSARECGAGCAGRHSAPRPLPWPPATPRAVDSSGAWAQGDLGPPPTHPHSLLSSPQPGLEGSALELRAHLPPELPPTPRPAAGRAWQGAPPPGQPLQRGARLRGGNTKERARREQRSAGARSRRAGERAGSPPRAPSAPLPPLPARRPPPSRPGAARSRSLRARPPRRPAALRLK